MYVTEQTYNEMKSLFTFLTKGRCVKVTNIVHKQPDEDTFSLAPVVIPAKWLTLGLYVCFIWNLEAQGQEVWALLVS